MKKLIISMLFFCFHIETLPCESKKVSLALIGAGGKQAQEYFKLLKNTVSFVAFIQPNPREDICELALAESIPIFYNLESTLNSIPFDGALVAVPHRLHFAYTQELIYNGKFVIKEKPLAITTAQANFYQTAYAQGLPSICTIVQRQFQLPFIRAQEDITHIGNIYSFKYEYALNLPGETSGWRAKKSLSGGGALIDMGYHAIDILTTLFGIPQKIAAQFAYKTEKTDESTDDEAFLLLTYPKNIVGSVIISRYGSEKKEILEIFGDKGSIKITPQQYALCIHGHTITEQNHYSKQDSLKDMFTTYLKNIQDHAYNTKELTRHVNNVHLIENLYKTDTEL